MNEPKQATEDGENMIGIPNIEREQENWELVDEVFVDHSGFGRPGEPALTIKEFHATIKAGLGYGVVEAGQFQLFVGVFEKN